METTNPSEATDAVDPEDPEEPIDVCIVGGGVAGLAAAIFTARAGLRTLIVDGGASILARNASLENYPGFPGGVDARRYLEMAREQASEAGATVELGTVTGVTREGEGEGVRIDTEGGEALSARYVIAASWPDSSYLPGDVERRERGSKHVVVVDDAGRTDQEGIYAAGKLADEPHQAIVAAGHGARVGLAVIQDSMVPFYHDWVAPEGYFTGREREVPPACEEIDDEERRRRDAEARERLRERLADPMAEAPTMHPSVER